MRDSGGHSELKNRTRVYVIFSKICFLTKIPISHHLILWNCENQYMKSVK